ncbi:hypothetical protein PAMC26510_10740 [Caballeronia sordidicola]|uniref:Uncharacterized protein n=1 Tax=Caballeronia sordidicola TaxID=196367 RepID=A0A242MZY0_CABSO|nr:hypothetical protein PAMC26510_10740 [Caballeronia sordidicola]
MSQRAKKSGPARETGQKCEDLADFGDSLSHGPDAPTVW